MLILSKFITIVVIVGAYAYILLIYVKLSVIRVGYSSFYVRVLLVIFLACSLD